MSQTEKETNDRARSPDAQMGKHVLTLEDSAERGNVGLFLHHDTSHIVKITSSTAAASLRLHMTRRGGGKEGRNFYVTSPDIHSSGDFREVSMCDPRACD